MGQLRLLRGGTVTDVSVPAGRRIRLEVEYWFDLEALEGTDEFRVVLDGCDGIEWTPLGGARVPGDVGQAIRLAQPRISSVEVDGDEIRFECREGWIAGRAAEIRFESVSGHAVDGESLRAALESYWSDWAERNGGGVAVDERLMWAASEVLALQRVDWIQLCQLALAVEWAFGSTNGAETKPHCIEVLGFLLERGLVEVGELRGGFRHWPESGEALIDRASSVIQAMPIPPNLGDGFWLNARSTE